MPTPQRLTLPLCALLATLLLSPCAVRGETLVLRNTKAEVYFSPKGGAEAAIIRALEGAKQEICVLAYSFTSAPVDEALVAAHQRGVRVFAVLDKSQLTVRGSKLQHLLEVGIPVLIDSAHAIAHNKGMILDKKRVITGSFNFAKSAEYRNSENLLILHNRALSSKYLQDFQRHVEHSQGVPLEDLRGNETR